jgi:hypothetical protein
VFYDRDEESNLWGKNLYEYLSEIYSRRATFCIIFISVAYARKRWTAHERLNAEARAFEENREYILPVKLDDTEIPGIPSIVGHMDLRHVSREALVNAAVEKVRAFKLRQKAT